jgi:hypothetical protein
MCPTPHATCLYPADRNTYSLPDLTHEERRKVPSDNTLEESDQ